MRTERMLLDRFGVAHCTYHYALSKGKTTKSKLNQCRLLFTTQTLHVQPLAYNFTCRSGKMQGATILNKMCSDSANSSKVSQRWSGIWTRISI